MTLLFKGVLVAGWLVFLGWLAATQPALEGAEERGATLMAVGYLAVLTGQLGAAPAAIETVLAVAGSMLLFGAGYQFYLVWRD